jgi:predicted ferric reductase
VGGRATSALVIGAYAAFGLLPLVIAGIDPPPRRREFAIEFGVALGFIGLAVIGLQSVLTARFPRLAAPFGLDALLHFHRLTGILAFALVLAHVVILISMRRRFLEFLNPFDSFVRAAALWAVLGALTLLIVLTLARRQLRIPYQWWRIGHGVLALAVLLLGTVHVIRVDHYMSQPWKAGLVAAFGAASAGLLGWTRVARPILQLRHPYRVAEVRTEGPGVWTVAVEPVGHAGMRFRAGQFAWLALGQRPWDIDSHPFSFSSSAARADRLEFTIKALGDFTARIGEVPPGTAAYLDGPYGNFVLDNEDEGAVLIAGGVGLTPVLSILRTMRDRGDRRPAWLVYGEASKETLLCRQELDTLAAEGRLNLVYVLERPGEGWTGERGLITPAVLERALAGARGPRLRYFVCGPAPMMDAVESWLVRSGVSPGAIRSERFNIA